MKKIILSAVFAFSALAFLPSSSKAQNTPKDQSNTIAQSTSTSQGTTDRAMNQPEPTNALAAWSAGYQYGISHGWGQEDSLYWANVQMKLWIYHHGY
ncbi:hypothetical protein [Pedobacter miscanthi]|uniref:Uncharacterized protein n=1 Tax=Pedobacter miscanthi TaxID=2259170 RepID=A0A366LCW1_9SPHI|nr:hypothetical protein [Pedobacter miscanthi]RBQ11725.1 hypothetical protein DRW42_00135 [Pedobacter miscanthi]